MRKEGADARARPVIIDLTCLVLKIPLRVVSGLNQTLGGGTSSQGIGVSGCGIGASDACVIVRGFSASGHFAVLPVMT
jgi:hypothetical protein